jgi:hypothetical protein
MPEQFDGMNTDGAGRQAAANYSGASLVKPTSYTITAADIANAGGWLHVKCTTAAANDQTLPRAFTVRGAKVTLLKSQLSTNALAARANAIDKIENGTAGARYQNVTSEFGSVTLWADPTSTAAAGEWRVIAQDGTWVAAA